MVPVLSPTMLDKSAIESAQSDDELFGLIGEELQRRLPDGRSATDEYVQTLQALPVGLRAMAATYELDVSLTLDDFGWHFGNWHHKGLAAETEKGLIELGATRLAEMFREAFWHAQRFWNDLARDDLASWYHGSELEKAVTPLNEEAWRMRDESTILDLWPTYARQFPERMY